MITQSSERSRWGLSSDWRSYLLPLFAGVGSALALTGVYLGILTLGQTFSHALDQLSRDILLVSLVAVGLGTQVGLYTYLRVNLRAARIGGVTAMTGTGTGTSTVGMVACCAHHLTDIAPLLGLTGASALSGAAAFLTEWKIPLIFLGLGMNAVSIVLILRTIRRVRTCLATMNET